LLRKVKAKAGTKVFARATSAAQINWHQAMQLQRHAASKNVGHLMLPK
jgi:hypothetical protein